MDKKPKITDPNEYVSAIDGWRRAIVDGLRATVVGAAIVAEYVKWGHLVYFNNGPVLLIRAEDERVLLGFWRGKRLASIGPLLKPGGKYEMATAEFREGSTVDAAIVKKLVEEAVALNEQFGDPTKMARQQLI